MSLLSPPKSYLYGEYQDDASLKATRDAYNKEAESIYSWLATTALGNYSADPISGAILDWVAQGLFGMVRKVLYSTAASYGQGSFADASLADLSFSSAKSIGGDYSYLTLTDDQFRRAITWNVYSADGLVFSTLWLRRRIARFLYGANGQDVVMGTYINNISIEWSSKRSATVTVNDSSVTSTLIGLLNSALSVGYLQVPLGYTILVSAA